MKTKTINWLKTISFILLSFSINAQVIESNTNSNAPEIIYKSSIAPNGQIRCASMEIDSIRRANNPSLPSLYEEELWLQEKIATRKAEENLNKSTYTPKATLLTIPIIFHIFTDGSGPDNVSATIVQHQLDQLNLDYRNLAGSGFSVAADIEIEFCLAIKDPNGNFLAEPGINRVTTYGQGPFSDTQFENTYKAATIWDPNNYFNVWVANLSGGILGYAQFPSNSGLGGLNTNEGPASTDGCVIGYTTLGSIANPQGSSSAQYNKGRTLTHEAGHWLGLRHIWGDGGCSVDDFCNDTPKSDAANYNCPNTNSCTDPNPDPRDMVENYMDYTNDACMNTFTEDQKTRIRTVMSICPRRASLANSTACQSSGDDAGISSIDSPIGSICGSSINPTIVLKNYGGNTLTSVNIVYNIDGGTNSTINWTGNLASGASTNVNLGVMTPTSGAHVLNVSTNLPNGNTDGNNANDSQTSSFTIIIGGQIVTLTIDTDCYGEETYWELHDSGSTLIGSGGNIEVSIPPGGQQHGTAQGDAGAYGVEVQIVESFCLSPGCYDFVLYDDWGDGMNAAGDPGCTVNGNWVITDANSNVLAQMSTPNFGDSDASSFCLNSVTAANFNSSSPKCVNNQITFTDASSGATSWDWNFGTGATPPNATGAGPHVVTYSSTGVKSISLSINGGAEISNQSITVNANPNSPTISTNGPTTICQGQIVNLTSSQSSGNLWSTNSSLNTIAVSGAGSYTVTYTDANGCKATSSPITITVNPLPTVTLGTFSTLCVYHNPITLTGGTPSGGTYSGTSVNAGMFDPSIAGTGTHTISYSVTDGNNCTNTATSDLIVDNCAGIEENEDAGIYIYPNPSSIEVNILSKTSTINKITIYDATGRLIKTETNLNSNEVKVEMSNFASGIYNFEVKTNESLFRTRILKK